MRIRHAGDVARFDRWSHTYERSFMQRIFFEPSQRAALAEAAGTRPAVVLDVGCGTGKLLRDAGARWPDARLVGVDAAPGMLREASRSTPRAAFFLGHAERLPLASASVDLALSTISMHHWDDKHAGLREIARVLRPGGTFVLADVSAGRWMAALAGERPYWRAAERDRAFTAAGLRVLRHRGLRGRFVLVTVAAREA